MLSALARKRKMFFFSLASFESKNFPERTKQGGTAVSSRPSSRKGAGYFVIIDRAMKNINLKKIREASLALSRSTERERNLFLKHLSEALIRGKKKVLAANARDVQHATANKLGAAFIDRLLLDEKAFRELVRKVRSVQKLTSGLGEIVEKKKPVRGLMLTKVRVPLGVLAVIYEARPEVTTDVAALCIKSANAAILKGGSEALATNSALYSCIRLALHKSGLPKDAITFVATGDRRVTDALLKRHDAIDLVIARGSYSMVKAVLEKTRIPVLAHAAGGARIYVDRSADLTMAEKILVNAKLSKPAACNALDTILVDHAIARTFVPRITKVMHAHRVSVKKNMNWDTETLGPTVGIRVVKDAHAAAQFVNAHGKRHSEGIVANNKQAIRSFTDEIDAAAIFVNSSTRLHDGYVFGLGSEMGISTSKLHARGPVGLKELTTYKWVAYGHGNIR